MGLYIKEIFALKIIINISFKDLERWFLKMVHIIKDIGRKDICMEEENFHGKMDKNMKEIIELVKNKDMELFIFLKIKNIKVIGKMVDNMEKVL